MLGAFAASVSPAGAQDRLNFVGSADVSATGPGGSNLFIDFLTQITAVPTISGAFLPEISTGTTGTINDITVSAGGCVGCPVNPFVSIGGYTFTLTSTPVAPAGPFNFGPVQLFATPNGTSAALSVTGTVTGGDYGATVRAFQGTFSAPFTGETPAQVFASIGAGTRNVGYGAEFVVGAVIPEPSTYALMATGLVGLLGAARLRRRMHG